MFFRFNFILVALISEMTILIPMWHMISCSFKDMSTAHGPLSSDNNFVDNSTAERLAIFPRIICPEKTVLAPRIHTKWSYNGTENRRGLVPSGNSGSTAPHVHKKFCIFGTMSHL